MDVTLDTLVFALDANACLMAEPMSEPMSEPDAPSHKAARHPQSAQYTKAWHYRNFASVQATLAYLNTPPAQGPSEVSTTIRNDGTVGAFYYV